MNRRMLIMSPALVATLALFVGGCARNESDRYTYRDYDYGAGSTGSSGFTSTSSDVPAPPVVSDSAPIERWEPVTVIPDPEPMETITLGTPPRENSVSRAPGNASVSRSTTVSVPASTALPSTYTVQKGDSLWKISKRFYGSGAKWPQIAQANSLSNPDRLKVGQVLTLP